MSVKVIFEIVTRGGHAIPSSPEEKESIAEAIKESEGWLKNKGASLSFDTIDGGGAAVSIDEIEHITVTPHDVWMARQDPDYLKSIQAREENG